MKRKYTANVHNVHKGLGAAAQISRRAQIGVTTG